MDTLPSANILLSAIRSYLGDQLAARDTCSKLVYFFKKTLHLFYVFDACFTYFVWGFFKEEGGESFGGGSYWNVWGDELQGKAYSVLCFTR